MFLRKTAIAVVVALLATTGMATTPRDGITKRVQICKGQKLRYAFERGHSRRSGHLYPRGPERPANDGEGHGP
jgi:hypothetical protein